MIVFEIYVNGEKLTTIGANDPGMVLVTIASARRKWETENRISLDASGGNFLLEGTENLNWLEDCPLVVGDEITIRVIETDTVDEPSRREVPAPEMNDKREREFYYRLKAKMEAKYPRPRFRRVR